MKNNYFVSVRWDEHGIITATLIVPGCDTLVLRWDVSRWSPFSAGLVMGGWLDRYEHVTGEAIAEIIKFLSIARGQLAEFLK